MALPREDVERLTAPMAAAVGLQVVDKVAAAVPRIVRMGVEVVAAAVAAVLQTVRTAVAEAVAVGRHVVDQIV